jgi:hypothetical protein
MRSSIELVLFAKYNYDDQIKDVGRGRACSTKGAKRKLGESQKEREH